MLHSVHKNQLEIDCIPKRKTYRKKKKENPYDPSKDFLCTSQKAQALKKSMSLREKIDKASFSPHHSIEKSHQ